MIYFFKPSHEKIKKYLEENVGAYLTFADIGITKAGGIPPHNFEKKSMRKRLGGGQSMYQKARDAIDNMSMFDLPWVKVIKLDSKGISQGLTFAILARTFFVWTLNPVRIVYKIDETGSVDRYGFAIATLPGHEEIGEERFTVEWRHAGQSVWFEIFSFTRPRRKASRSILKPFVEWTVQKFINSSAEAMFKAVNKKI